MYDEVKVVDKESDYFGYGVEIDRELRESQLEDL